MPNYRKFKIDLEILQIEYNQHYEYIAQGAIIQSRANCYEHFFLERKATSTF